MVLIQGPGHVWRASVVGWTFWLVNRLAPQNVM